MDSVLSDLHILVLSGPMLESMGSALETMSRISPGSRSSASLSHWTWTLRGSLSLNCSFSFLIFWRQNIEDCTLHSQVIKSRYSPSWWGWGQVWARGHRHSPEDPRWRIPWQLSDKISSRPHTPASVKETSKCIKTRDAYYILYKISSNQNLIININFWKLAPKRMNGTQEGHVSEHTN